MKNFSNKKARTLIKEVGDKTPFIKIKDLFPDAKKRTFEKGEIPVLGYIKVHSKDYDKDQYSLLVNVKGNDYFMNVPSWYGVSLAEDFIDSGMKAEEYFDKAYIKEIEEFETKYKNNTYNIIVFEEDE